MNIIWVSANKFGYELLKDALNIRRIKIKAVITLSDKSKTVMYDSVNNNKWHKLGIKVFEIEELNEEKALIKKLSPDLIIMCGWRQLIDKKIINIPPKGMIGFHPTLLPYGRGPAPIINTILNGDTISGLTMFYITDGLDNGDIIAQERFYINKDDHAMDVYNKVVKAGKKIIKNYLPSVIQGTAPRIPQENSKAVVFKKLELKNNKIDLGKETLEDAYRKIKALSRPYKGAFIERAGKRLIIWEAELRNMK